ncbi:hypothetical protein SNEBB_000918 [Seison nebaliae]|nr:hypothetical protein SNEBB_000918 [Seison nebaliae]
MSKMSEAGVSRKSHLRPDDKSQKGSFVSGSSRGSNFTVRNQNSNEPFIQNVELMEKTTRDIYTYMFTCGFRWHRYVDKNNRISITKRKKRTVLKHMFDMFEMGLTFNPNSSKTARMLTMSPKHFQMQFEEMYIKTRDGELLHAYFLLQNMTNYTSVVPTILYLHDRGGNIGDRLPKARLLNVVCQFNVLLLDYRGFGQSTGEPTEFGVYMDAQAAFEYLLQRTDIDRNKLILFGRGIGAAIAIQVASHPENARRTLALIVENPFTSHLDVMAIKFRYIPIITMINNAHAENWLNSCSKIGIIVCPILFLRSRSSKTIKSWMCRYLFERAAATPLKRLNTYLFDVDLDLPLQNFYHTNIMRFIADVCNYFGETYRDVRHLYSLNDIPAYKRYIECMNKTGHRNHQWYVTEYHKKDKK